ncbi:MAG: GntR family transcriptional regulator [Hyphomicrobiales bacterium]|nr:GntR family transcriptional regulator [Hyphomicrobiales bacterium]
MNAIPAISTRPVYLQIRDILTLRITRKEWQRNQSLPSESEFANHFKVSVATVRKSLAVLEKEGLIYRRQGLGTFVTDRQSDAHRAKYARLRGPDGARIEFFLLELRITKSAASAEAAAALEIAVGADIYEIDRLRQAERETFLLDTCIMPADLCPGLDARRDECRGVTAIADEYGLLLDSFTQTVQTVPASEDFAAKAGYEAGAPVWKLVRTIRDFEGRVVEHRTAFVTPHHCTYLHEG